MPVLNDLHSALNSTNSVAVRHPKNTDEVGQAIREARAQELPIIPHGCRHAMGGQQFISDGIALDTRDLNKLHHIAPERHRITIGAGATWRELRHILQDHQQAKQLAIRQKQTGADHLSLGGALAANIHGRGLQMRPFIDDLESFTLVDPSGRVRKCSRNENRPWFIHATGGYGLFGVATEITLRLTERQNYQRHVRLASADEVIAQLEDRASKGHRYGDFQFEIDPSSPGFLRKGILSTYAPCTEKPTKPPILRDQDWLNLLTLAHTDKAAAFAAYAQHYLATDGAVYEGDSFQFTPYLEDYHREIDRRCGHGVRHSEMISEFYVPREELDGFLADAAKQLRTPGSRANVIYGTVRLIESEPLSALPWARENWACIVFNLCVEHSPVGIAQAKHRFRQLADSALHLGGSFYLTYHNWFTPDQLEAAHPSLREFLQAKQRLDPDDIFQSDWLVRLREKLDICLPRKSNALILQ